MENSHENAVVPIKVCPRCEERKPVCKRYIGPTVSKMLCSDCAMERRAVKNQSGYQARADEPPSDTGAYVTSKEPFIS